MLHHSRAGAQYAVEQARVGVDRQRSLVFLVPILRDWTLPRGGLYFVTPSARTRPAKIEALAAFFVEHLTAPSWRVVD